MFIGKLEPTEYSDKLHWMTAGTAIQAADSDLANDELLEHPTDDTLRSDGFLREEWVRLAQAVGPQGCSRTGPHRLAAADNSAKLILIACRTRFAAVRILHLAAIVRAYQANAAAENAPISR